MTGIPPDDLKALEQAAECLKVLAHPHRLRILQVLFRQECTVGEIADVCDISAATASEHLRLMQRCGFLYPEKVGRKVFYRIAEPHLRQLLDCLEDRFGRPCETD